MGPPNLKGIKYLNLSSCLNNLLTKPNIYAKFEQNRWFELYNLLPGFLMDTLLKNTRFYSAWAIEHYVKCNYEKLLILAEMHGWVLGIRSYSPGLFATELSSV